MSIFTKLTIRNLKLNKKRTIGTIIGIMLATSLICTVAGIATTLQKSMIATTVEETGYYHIKLSDITERDIEKFKNNRDVEAVNVVTDVGYSLFDGSTNSQRPYIHLYSLDKSSFNNMSLELIDGRYPENSNEIAINEDLLSNSSKEYKIGDTITLNLGDRYEGEKYVQSGFDYLHYRNEGVPEDVMELSLNESTTESDTILADSNTNASNTGENTLAESKNSGDALDDNALKEQETSENKSHDAESISNSQEKANIKADKTTTTEETLKVKTTKEFKIVGIISNNDLPIRRVSYLIDAGFTCVTNGLNDGQTEMYIALKKPYNCIESFKEMIGVDFSQRGEMYWNSNSTYNYSINYNLLNWESIELSDLASMIIALFIVITVIVMITSIYCIKNAFAISLTEKIRMYGMLSSVGATKKQIKKSVVQEGMILSLIGIPIGILVGTILVYILSIIVSSIIDEAINIKIVFNMPIVAIIIATILSFATIYLSCLSAARKARKVTPLEAIRSTNEIKIKRKKLKSPKFIKKIFGMGGVIAYKNLKRSKKKYKTTVVSIAISVFIFIATSTLITYAFEAMGGFYEDYDFNVNVSTYSNDGQNLLDILNAGNFQDYTLVYKIPSDTASSKTMQIEDKNILSDFGIERINNLEISSTPQIIVIGLNGKNFKEYAEKFNLNYDKIKDKIILNDYAQIFEDGRTIKGRNLKCKEGDTISGIIDGVNLSLEIAKITDEYPSGLYNTSYGNGLAVVNVDEYADKLKFVPENLTLNVENSADVTENINTNYKDVYAQNIEQQVKFYNAVKLLASVFAYGFIAIITLIGITNIFNTLTSNIELRQKEFAMLKSIGMTKKEFNRMVNLETIFYSVKALLYGIILGLIASFAIYKAFANSLDYGFIWPSGALLISVVFVFIIVFIIMRFAIGKINKQNIIETIRKENV